MKKITLIALIIVSGLLSGFMSISGKKVPNEIQNVNATIKFKLDMIVRPHTTVLHPAKMYGFVGIQVFKVTASKTELLKSFGDKTQYFFKTTEDNAFPYNGDVIYIMPNSPLYIREFLIPTNDWTNPNIKYEVRLWHHLKGKINGPNLDYGKYSQTYDLKNLLNSANDKSVTVRKTSKSSYAHINIYKQ